MKTSIEQKNIMIEFKSGEHVRHVTKDEWVIGVKDYKTVSGKTLVCIRFEQIEVITYEPLDAVKAKLVKHFGCKF